jgi:hypothetical protein
VERVKEKVLKSFEREKKAGFTGENEGKRRKEKANKATLNDSRQHSKVTGNEDWKTGLGKGEGEVLRRGNLGDNCKRFAIEQGDVDEQG